MRELAFQHERAEREAAGEHRLGEGRRHHSDDHRDARRRKQSDDGCREESGGRIQQDCGGSGKSGDSAGPAQRGFRGFDGRRPADVRRADGPARCEARQVPVPDVHHQPGIRRGRLLHEISRTILLDARAGRGPERTAAAGRTGWQCSGTGWERQHRLGQDLHCGKDRWGQELLRRAEHGAHEGQRRCAEGDEHLRRERGVKGGLRFTDRWVRGFAMAAIVIAAALPVGIAQTPASAPLEVPARTLPVPDTVSPEMRAINSAPLSPTWNVVPTSADEWKAMSAPSAGRGLPALRERFGVTSESLTVNGVHAYMVTPRVVPLANRNRLLVHVHGGCYVLGGGEAATSEAISMAAFGQFKVLSVDYRRPP